MSYTFRIRYEIAKACGISSEQNSIIFEHPFSHKEIRLVNPQENMPLTGAKSIVVSSSGYKSEEDALANGQTVEHALLVSCAKHRVGISFAAKRGQGVFTRAGLSMLEQVSNRRVLNDEHGLMTHETEPAPAFAQMNFNAALSMKAENVIDTIKNSLLMQSKLSERELVSFSLYNSSFFQPDRDSRFVMLMMAVESMLEPEARSPESVNFVSTLINFVSTSGLPSREKDSMLGTLRWLRFESITQSGKRLAASRLGDQRYNDMSAAKFFTYCYELRSKLVHGKTPLSGLPEIGNVVSMLEIFVSDLLTADKVRQVAVSPT